MRTITVNIYKYDELPTEEAKETARNWWKDLEALSPSWLSEHIKSAVAAKKFLDSYGMYDFDKLYSTALEMKAKGDCPWTGYTGDLTAIESIVKACELYDDLDTIKKYVRICMSADYEKQLEASLEDENAEEMIQINEYEFTEDGKIHH